MDQYWPAESKPDPWAAPPPSRRAPNVGVVALVAALIGALVGGGIAGGIVALVDDGGNSTTVVTRDPNAAVRPSTALAKPGDIRSILAKVEPAVVRIDATTQPSAIGSQSGTGTGFIVDA